MLTCILYQSLSCIYELMKKFKIFLTAFNFPFLIIFNSIQFHFVATSKMNFFFRHFFYLILLHFIATKRNLTQQTLNADVVFQKGCIQLKIQTVSGICLLVSLFLDHDFCKDCRIVIHSFSGLELDICEVCEVTLYRYQWRM